MLSEWIKYVGEEDQILHLGDIFMGKQGSPDRWASVISRLPGIKFLIKGNHDKLPDSTYEKYGFTIVEPFIVNHLNAVDQIAFTHEPITSYNPCGNYFKDSYLWNINVCGHTHANIPNPEFDGDYVPGKTYINSCVEVTDYKPVQLGNLLNRKSNFYGTSYPPAI